ncbi:MAG TPA: hypothetical protein VM031_04550 [Phycisphaerae bacterium]|nr:hypothetical protein [Phycisphaerae bacterium]
MTGWYARSAAGLAAFARAMLCIWIAGASAGCLKTVSYVDSITPAATYGDLTRPAARVPVRLTVDWQCEGVHWTVQSRERKEFLSDVLLRSGVASPTSDASPGRIPEIHVVINNVPGTERPDDGSPKATGFTLGVVGCAAHDAYLLTGVLRLPGKSEVTRSYKGEIITTIGRKAAPEGLAPIDTGKAVDAVVERLFLCFLRDLQREGLLPAK